MAAPALGALAGRMSAPGDSYHSRARQLVRFIEQSGKPLRDRYRGWVAVSDDATVARLMGGAAGSSPADLGEPARAALADVQDLPVLDQLLYLNFTTYLPDDLSVKVDRMSMAHSLEARSPFLDSALIDHAVSIPADRRVGVKRLKPVLRSAFSDLLPTEIWDRRKQGFGAPLGQWFRGSLAEVFGDEVLAFDSCVRDVIEMDALDDLWREHSTGFRNHGSTLWTILTLERWLRTLKRPLEECPPAVGVSAA